jgi:hypothetical protein
MSPRNLAFLAAVAMLLASGTLYHLLAKDSDQLDPAAERVALVPLVIRAWQGHDEEVDRASFEQAGAKGYWMRSYVNPRTNESILVILMCGRAGKMSVHTPEVCYRGAGYELHDQPAACALKSAGGQDIGSFWTAQFTKKAAVPTHLRLYWAWSAHGAWEASAAPRWQYRGAPFLYKLYVSRDISRQPGVAAGVDVTAQFMRELLPVLDETLFPQMVQSPSAKRGFAEILAWRSGSEPIAQPGK